MTSVTSEYTDIQTQPALDDWSSFLRICSLEHSRLSELRQTARVRLIDSAQKFVLRLNSLAEDADLPAVSSPVLTGDPAERPIVMTGHQPVVFHSGLTYKYETTQEFAAANKAIGIAIVIDTDQGDAGQFSYPEAQAKAEANFEHVTRHPDHPVLAIDTLAEVHKLFGHGRLKSAADLTAKAELVAQRLATFEQSDAAASVSNHVNQYAQLSASKANMMEANTIMRWQQGIGDRLLEIPLSAVAAFPECLMLTADILKQPIRFASAYNAALHSYREVHNIRNAANPFPNLKVAESSCELPFWIVNHNRGTRHVLEVELDGNVTRLMANGKTVDSFAGNITSDSLEPMLLQNLQVIPRGALITAFLRLLFSDLFVHGTGGARYDRFTDEFIRDWWNAEPPPFTVATASRHLFQQTRQSLERLREIKTNLRELQYNPQRYFGQQVFSGELEARLVELMRDKQAAVDCMKSFHAEGQSAKEAGTEIQNLTNQIKQAVSEEFDPQLRQLNSISAEQMDAINCRTYPWFFFSR